MWYTINEMIGKILLVSIVGGGAVYGGYKVLSGPPVLKQNGDKSDSRGNGYTREVVKQHERHMRDLQEDQSRRFNEQMKVGRSVGS